MSYCVKKYNFKFLSVLLCITYCKQPNSKFENEAEKSENAPIDQSSENLDRESQDIYILSEEGDSKKIFDLFISDLEQEENDFNSEGLQLTVRAPRTGIDIDVQPVVQKPPRTNFDKLSRQPTIRITNVKKSKTKEPALDSTEPNEIKFNPVQNSVRLEFPLGDILDVKGGGEAGLRKLPSRPEIGHGVKRRTLSFMMDILGKMSEAKK